MVQKSNTPPSPKSKDATAQALMNAHRSADPAITGVFRIERPGHESNPTEPLKLLEINPNTTASGIMPVGLSPDALSGILFRSIIVEIHPTELQALQEGRLRLPDGWKVNFDAPLYARN